MGDLEEGHARIAGAITQAKNTWPGKPIIFIEHLRNFGDAMHSTIIIRHYRRVKPDSVVIFGVSERYASEFETLKSLADGPHLIIGLPHGPEFPNDGPVRVAWTRAAAQIPGVGVVTPSVHPYGWKGGSLADAIFHNAGIKALSVPRRPVLPVDIADYVWADQFMAKYALTGPFVTMEYISYSLKVHELDWYASLVKNIRCTVVGLSGPKEPPLPGAVMAHCTYRQAKVLIMRSKCFVGCASGNGLLAISEGCETPMVEIVEPHISYKALDYLNTPRTHVVTGFAKQPHEIAANVNSIVRV